MARLVKGSHVVETSVPREVVQLKAQGYREQARVKRAEGGKAAEQADKKA